MNNHKTKQFLKKLLKVLFVGVVAMVILAIVFVQYLKSDLNSSFDSAEIQAFVTLIKDAEKQPESFTNIYVAYRPMANTLGILFDWTFENYNRSCPCLQIARNTHGLTDYENGMTGNPYALALTLEKYVSQEQCLNYMLVNFDFLNQQIGISSASNFYFQKAVADLNEDEIIAFVLLTKNPIYYSPLKHRERLEEAISNIRAQLSE